MTEVARRGLMFVLSSPSGAGKTTLARLLLESDPNLDMSVSVTTRERRSGEVDGRDYRFVDETTFDAMGDAGELLESATVFDFAYGTPKKPVIDAIGQGRDVLFDVDWQGAEQLIANAREDVVTVFVLPPSIAELHERLKRRARDSAEIVARRMQGAAEEIRHWDRYDYVIINDDVGQSLDIMKAILTAERVRRERQIGLKEQVAKLLSDL